MRTSTNDKYLTKLINLLTKKLGFIEREKSYNPNNFGNLHYLFETANIMLMLIRDRGQYFIEVCSKEDIGNWYQLEHVVILIEPEYIYKVIKCKDNEAEQIKMYFNIMELYYKNIIDIFEQSRYRETISKLNDIRKEYFPKSLLP